MSTRLFRSGRRGHHARAARQVARGAREGRHVGGARRAVAPAAEDGALLRGGKTVDVPLAEVVAGDRFVVRAGESIPVDGIVREGASSVDESMLTGESRAVVKAAGASGLRRDAEPGRPAHVRGDRRRQRRRCSPGSCASSRKRRARRRRSSAWPTASPAYSCRSSW